MRQLRNDDETAAAGFRPLPRLLDIGERNLIGLDTQRAFCAPVKNLLHCGNENIA